MNEWGLPDWTDLKAYSETSSWPIGRWRWEFMRRRADYRDEFRLALKEVADPFPSHAAEVFDKSNLTGGKLRAWPFMDEGAKKYCLYNFYDPRISNWFYFQPQWTDELREGSGTEIFGQSYVMFPDDWRKPVFAFDSDAPIEPQLSQVRDILRGLQAGRAHMDPSFPKNKVNAKNHESKWHTYLRLLDAKSAGASLSQMAEILPDSMGRRDARAAGNVLAQAKAQSFRF